MDCDIIIITPVVPDDQKTAAQFWDAIENRLDKFRDSWVE